MYVRYCITRNRRAPIVAMYGRWPAKSGLARSCRAGVEIGRRAATTREEEFVSEQPRFVAIRWTSLLTMLRDERDELGMDWCRTLINGIRQNRHQVTECFAAVKAKTAKHSRKVSAQ